MKLKRKHVFRFWGGMDLFYLIQFLGWNLYHQRLPFYDDILSYLQLVPTLGPAAAWLFPLNVLLIVDEILAALFAELFFFERRHCPHFRVGF